jgi:hypothetical protein
VKNQGSTCLGGVAQWTSHPPQEQEDPGSNPARVKGLRKMYVAVLMCINDLICIVYGLKKRREIKALAKSRVQHSSIFLVDVGGFWKMHFWSPCPSVRVAR